MNVGSSKWNMLANYCIPCQCPDNWINAINRYRRYMKQLHFTLPKFIAVKLMVAREVSVRS